MRRSRSHLLGPIVLGTGILLSGAALIVWIAPLVRRAPAPPSAPYSPEPRSDNKPAPAAASAPAFSSRTFLGTWNATMRGSRLRQGVRSLDVPVEDPRSFAFSIAQKDGAFFLDGATPMAMKAEDRCLVGESRGVAVRLTFVPPGIAGEIFRKSSDSDAQLVLEFEAERAP
jgi:hypothetical protein